MQYFRAQGLDVRSFASCIILRGNFDPQTLPNSKKFLMECPSNNILKCTFNRTRCILIQNFIELGKIRGLKFSGRVRSLVLVNPGHD